MFLFKKNSKKVTDHSKTRRIASEEGALSYLVSNLQQLGKRSSQEDSFALINALDVNAINEKGLFAIVADGMGGMKNGKLVSEEAVTGFVQRFHNLDREVDIPTQLLESIHNINELLSNKFKGEGGTTVAMVIIYKGMAYWASVGDSTIYLKRNGILVKLNKEHNYRSNLYLEEIYKEVINKDEVESNKDGARLSEFLGNRKVEEIDFNKKPLKLRKNDTLLLCTDGVSSFLDERLISDALNLSPDYACEQLCKLIDEKSMNNQDNYTALIISCVD